MAPPATDPRAQPGRWPFCGNWCATHGRAVECWHDAQGTTEMRGDELIRITSEPIPTGCIQSLPAWIDYDKLHEAIGGQP